MAFQPVAIAHGPTLAANPQPAFAVPAAPTPEQVVAAHDYAKGIKRARTAPALVVTTDEVAQAIRFEHEVVFQTFVGPAIDAALAPTRNMVTSFANEYLREKNVMLASNDYPATNVRFLYAYNNAAVGLAPPAPNLHTQYVYAPPPAAVWGGEGPLPPASITFQYLEQIWRNNAAALPLEADQNNADLILGAIGEFYGFPADGAVAFPGNTADRARYILDFLCQE